jgi:hypothetical protein
VARQQVIPQAECIYRDRTGNAALKGRAARDRALIALPTRERPHELTAGRLPSGSRPVVVAAPRRTFDRAPDRRLAPRALLRARRLRPSAPCGAGGSGRLAGVVHDSLLTGAPLPAAEVWIDGTTLTALTGAGRPLPLRRGARRPAPRDLRAPRRSRPSASARRWRRSRSRRAPTPRWRLATPAPTLVHGALCPGPAESRTVRAARAARACGCGVAVRARVGELGGALARPRGAARTPRELAAEVDAEGAFRLCGVPTDVPVEVRAEPGDVALSVAQVSFFGREVALTRLTLPARRDRDEASGASGGAARARRDAGPDGSPRRARGAPVAGGDTSAAVVTRADGSSRCAASRRGRVVVEARAIGFRPVRARVAAPPARHAVLLTLGADATVLAATRVVARARRRCWPASTRGARAGRGAS